MDKQTDVIDNTLKNYGFVPTADNVTWRYSPVNKKIKIACSAAEKAEPTIGGSKLLALLVKDLAIQYESVRDNPALIEFLNKEVSASDIRFAPFESKSPSVKLPLDVRKAIKTIANYYYGGRLGNPYIILSEDFKLPDTLIDRILEESRTHEEIFRRAFKKVPYQEIVPTINRLIEKIVLNYEAVLHELNLKPFISELFTGLNGSERKFHHSFYEHEKNFYSEKAIIPKLSNPFDSYSTKLLLLSYIKQKIPEYNGQVHPLWCNGDLTAVEEKWFDIFHKLISSEELTGQERILLFEALRQLDSYREILKTNDNELLAQLEKCSRSEKLDWLNKSKNLQLERVKLETEIARLNRIMNTKKAIFTELLKIGKPNQIKAEAEIERMLKEGKSKLEIMRKLRIFIKR